jgi:hypothetical protein
MAVRYFVTLGISGFRGHFVALAPGHFVTLVSVLGSGLSRDLLGLLDCLDAAPFVCRLRIIGPLEGEPESVRQSVFGVAAATALRDLDQAERLDHAKRLRQHAVVNAVIFKLLVGHNQRPVAVAGVRPQFDIDSVDDAMAGRTEATPCWRLQELDKARRPLSGDAVTLALAGFSCGSRFAAVEAHLIVCSEH